MDLWRIAPFVDSTPVEFKEATFRRLSFLGAEEVRDLSRVPPEQLAAFPKRTAGQVRALEQRASTLVHWTIQPGRDAYFSFTPLGAFNGCDCTYRVGIREAPDKVREIYRVKAGQVTPFARAAIAVDLSPWTGRRIDLLTHVEGSAATPLGQPVPSVLWGSPALYGRKAVRIARREGPPNILLIGIDTLRADALGAWGRNPSLTPALDRLAGQSDVWPDAFSTFNVTNPSFASILTGLYGKNHGVYDLQTPLPPGQTTLAEILSGAGYDTMAVISASHLGDPHSGLGQGFREVTTASEHFAAELPVDLTMDWLTAHGGRPRPFFIWLHLFDPHTPHTPPEPYALGFRPAKAAGLSPVRAWIPFRQPGPRSFAENVLGGQRDLYDGEVAYLDRQVGRLLDFLESRGMLEDTVIAVVADHGENLGDHGLSFRHLGLWDSTTHVPLMIRWPGLERKGRRLAGLVQTIDVFPTLLATAGLPIPPQDGTDLRELTGEGHTGRKAVFSEHADRLSVSVRTAGWRYGVNEGNDRFLPNGPYLYDLKTDPQETKSLAGQGLPAEKELNDLLIRWLATRRQGARPEPRGLTEEEKGRLRALGYGG
ncbi:MAG: choline-sulfatase [Acidobacteriota bacterium]|jgi:arylsulfatase A-like enzyme|nr:choline-sulfatase [Acidobacteriota bacterium]